MKHGKHKDFFKVLIQHPEGYTFDSRAYKTEEGAMKRLLALQESNNNSALYEGGILFDYKIAKFSRE